MQTEELEEFWGPELPSSPNYGAALRHFIRYKCDAATLGELRRLRLEQADLERKWKAGRESLQHARATRAKLEDYDQRVHFQASRYASRLTEKLGALGLPLFVSGANSASLSDDRAKFLLFISDLLA